MYSYCFARNFKHYYSSCTKSKMECFEEHSAYIAESVCVCVGGGGQRCLNTFCNKLRICEGDLRCSPFLPRGELHNQKQSTASVARSCTEPVCMALKVNESGLQATVKEISEHASCCIRI
jgi:hypothetical protein